MFDKVQKIKSRIFKTEWKIPLVLACQNNHKTKTNHTFHNPGVEQWPWLCVWGSSRTILRFWDAGCQHCHHCFIIIIIIYIVTIIIFVMIIIIVIIIIIMIIKIAATNTFPGRTLGPVLRPPDKRCKSHYNKFGLTWENFALLEKIWPRLENAIYCNN